MSVLVKFNFQSFSEPHHLKVIYGRLLGFQVTDGVSEVSFGSGSNQVDVVLALRMAINGDRSAAFWSRRGLCFLLSFVVSCLFCFFSVCCFSRCGSFLLLCWSSCSPVVGVCSPVVRVFLSS